ncbi:MAG TPA: hypothetical protein VMT28_17980 [Terriglobales bacterium]|jgi:hypothetical protein|nr:hypothetical protein [Terriglobales bacterium]
MRQVIVLCLLVLLSSGLAAAQATVVGGYASNWPTAYGVYVVPSVPRVITPSVALESVSPSAVGASNATFGNVAGASNATLSIVAPPPVGVFAQPVWYGPNPDNPNNTVPLVVVSGGQAEAEVERPSHRPSEIGPASFQSTVGVARLSAAAGPAPKASRTYTNQDIERFNQTTGNVKWDGKSEQIK